ncbi:MAG: TIGR03435 family protein [Acidobacteriia bacterium]|nr:TIGR03435 family protein [Terriglobia bacterium]
MSLRSIGLLAFICVLAMIAVGQDPSRPAFEVASVKPVDLAKLGDAISMNIGTVRHEEVTFGNATLNDCVRFAYGMGSDAQIAGPDWIRSKEVLYDVVAKGMPGAPREQLQAMMQTLLAERFKLVTHREQKEMSYFALLPAKNGPKIQPVKDVPDGFRGTTYGGRINAILPMPMLAYLLSRFETERPIIDETGLRGMYEVKLQWTLQQLQNPDSAPGPSLFTALSEQLGLRLEARKGPVEILVVDSAEKVPVEN